MSRRFFTALFVLVIAIAALPATRAAAAISTCRIHNGMKIWFLDYAEDDYTLSHPLGVREGTVEINERAWHAKCAADGPNTKVFVPFTYRKNGQTLEDSRWPQDVYLTRAEAERAYKAKV